MALKEVYKEQIMCFRCGKRDKEGAKYCAPCRPLAKDEQTRQSHSDPTVRERARIRARVERMKKKGEVIPQDLLQRLEVQRKRQQRQQRIEIKAPPKKPEEIREIIVFKEPSRAAIELQNQMNSVEVAIDNLEVLKVGETGIPIGFSTGDSKQNTPHFHIRQGKAEIALTAEYVGGIRGYEEASFRLQRAISGLKR